MDWKDHKEKIDAIIPEEAKVSDLILDLIERRLELGLTQKDLEKRTGIKQPAITRIETEGVVPNVETIIKLASAMGLKLSLEKMKSENKERCKRKLAESGMINAKRGKYTIKHKIDNYKIKESFKFKNAKKKEREKR
ncbi:helix-turn-helix domain-containing protein [Natranaerofaba carboxydovora]|uniref:helix-turn-helix domain-containing protein n=1 Tax=Natranaerofaba carboxydovora TaxID=2742683 RepID=UPI001F1299D2|nr:helix-turn-helix transcriptional regulator [Natranaerofaba carboxydovora]UMZ72838.1 helix-turn-helix protein [Natranaerofaba carboxydovora]